MSIEVKLPELGDGIDSGDVLEVLVKEGDTIKKEQGILELETDKATVEVPSSHEGRVSKVHVATGDTVEIGQLLVTLEEAAAGDSSPQPADDDGDTAQAEQSQEDDDGSDTSDDDAQTDEQEQAAQSEKSSKSKSSSQTKQEQKASQAEPEDDEQDDDDEEGEGDADRQRKPATQSKSRASGSEQAAPARRQQVAPTRSDEPVPAGPAVRRFAREVGVDLNQVEGSGDGGRITRDDVLEVVRHANQAAAKSGKGKSKATESAQQSDAWGPIRVEKLSKIRRTIAAKMHESWTTVPRVTNFDDADVTELERIRQSSKEDYLKKGIKLTGLPFVIKSLAMALREHPAINASLDLEAGQVTYKEYVNIGIAVDTPRGLVVPVLRDVDDLSISEIARGLGGISEKVKDGSYSIDDLRGATFTISNLGAIGGTYSTPIVNVPEVAILLIGRSRKMPVVVNDEVKIRLMMPLSLSYDHRLVDGAAAARFLNDVIDYLEAPSRLLLAP